MKYLKQRFSYLGQQTVRTASQRRWQGRAWHLRRPKGVPGKRKGSALESALAFLENLVEHWATHALVRIVGGQSENHHWEIRSSWLPPVWGLFPFLQPAWRWSREVTHPGGDPERWPTLAMTPNSQAVLKSKGSSNSKPPKNQADSQAMSTCQNKLCTLQGDRGIETPSIWHLWQLSSNTNYLRCRKMWPITRRKVINRNKPKKTEMMQ